MAKNQHHPKWTIEQLTRAFEEVKNGAPKRKTAEKYGIPWGTFSDKLSGRRKMEDHQKTILSEREEKEIATYIKEMGIRGFGKTKEELFIVVKNYLDFNDRRTQWEDNRPTDKWYRLFRKRHADIVYRKPQQLGKQRALLTKNDILDWFQNFTTTIKEIDATIFLEPERIYNADESGFQLNAISGRVLTSMDNKFVYQVGSENKTMITALVCCSATDHFPHPMLIYPNTQFRGFKPSEVFVDSYISKSENGWISQKLFLDWLKAVFQPQTAHLKKPVLLLVDGHSSHQSWHVSQFCDENQIILYCLPPHSSHILQPLDVGVFKTMKGEWKLAVKRQNETEIVTKRTFAKTFKDAYERTVSKKLAQNAFKACGIFPLNSDNVKWSKVLPSSESTITTINAASNTLIEHDTPHPVSNPNTVGLPHCSSSSSIQSTATATATNMSPPRSATPDAISSDTTLFPPSTSTGTATATTSQQDTNLGGSSDSVSTLRKFAMICAQIGDVTLQTYFTRLEEGYDCEDSLYTLWKSYHIELVSKLSSPVGLIENLQHDDTRGLHEAARPKPKTDPLALTAVKKGSRVRKTVKVPSLISGSEFRELLIQKETDLKNEEMRKQKVQLEKEEKRKAVALQKKQMKAIKDTKKRERDEKKRIKNIETQQRKEDRKRKQEERKRDDQQKKRKISRKLYNDSETETSVDESEMRFDDNSSDGHEFEENIDDDFSDDQHAAENNIREGQENDAPTPMAGEAQDTENKTNDSVDSVNFDGSFSQIINVINEVMNDTDRSTPTRNMWVDLALGSLVQTPPSQMPDSSS